MQQLPRGLSEEDSIAMLRAIVENWIRKEVLTDVAERNVGDMEEIDRLTEEYRENLILSRYLSNMAEGRSVKVDQSRVDRYWRERGDSMILDEPLVKGIYLKVDEKDPRLSLLKQWMQNGDEASVDRIESSGLRGATQYEYFMDRWHPWHEVAEQMPYRFYDADAFLSGTTDFETNYRGSVYLLHISAYVASGERMPVEYAKEQISEALRQGEINERRNQLLQEVYSQEMEAGRLKKGLYDPATGKFSKLTTGKGGGEGKGK